MIDWLLKNMTNIANLASILGFVLTVFVLLSLRRIRKYYSSKVRIPVLMKTLRKATSSLIEYMNDYENSTEDILLKLGTIEVTIRAIRRRISGDSKKLVKRATTMLKGINRKEMSRESVSAVYAQLSKVVESIKQDIEDRNWEN